MLTAVYAHACKLSIIGKISNFMLALYGRLITLSTGSSPKASRDPVLTSAWIWPSVYANAQKFLRTALRLMANLAGLEIC